MRHSLTISRIPVPLRRALYLALGAVAVGCASDPKVVRRYDPQCEELGSFGVTAHTKHSAVRIMKQRVVQLGSNTLLIGEEALQQLNIHRAQQSIERTQEASRTAFERGEQLPLSTIIKDPVIEGVRIPEGKSAFDGAALNCR